MSASGMTAMTGRCKRLKKWALSRLKIYLKNHKLAYADDFLIGIIGSKEDAKEIKSKIKEFLNDTLKLELSDEKTLITHSKKKAHFLGYDIYVRRTHAAKRNRNGNLKRAFNGKIALEVSIDCIKKKLLDYGAMKLEVNVYGKEVWRAKSRYFLKDNDDFEILDQYNSEIRGLRNYYAIANNSAILNSSGYIMCQSLFKTYGTKYRCSMKKAMDKFRIDSDFGVKFTAKGKTKVRLFYNEGFARKPLDKSAKVDIIPNTVKYASKTSLIDRLKAEKCELGFTRKMQLNKGNVLKRRESPPVSSASSL